MSVTWERSVDFCPVVPNGKHCTYVHVCENRGWNCHLKNHSAVIYRVCSESIRPHNVKNRDICWRRYKIQETLCIGQWRLSPLQSWHLWDLTQFSQLSSAALSYFPESHQWAEISSFSKVILVLGKARSHRAPNLGWSGAELPGWFDVLPKYSARDVIHERACYCDEAANHQSPRAVLHLSTDEEHWSSTPY